MPSFLYTKKNKDGSTSARVDLDLYYPRFLERILQLKANCLARGIAYYPSFGYRSWLEQHKLRGLYLSGKGGRAAPAGLSAHNYGLAEDCIFDRDPNAPGLQPGWEPKHYLVLDEEAKKVGLITGRAYNDYGHVQWPGFETADQLRGLQKIFNACGNVSERVKLSAVWAYLDTLP